MSPKAFKVGKAVGKVAAVARWAAMLFGTAQVMFFYAVGTGAVTDPLTPEQRVFCTRAGQFLSLGFWLALILAGAFGLASWLLTKKHLQYLRDEKDAYTEQGYRLLAEQDRAFSRWQDERIARLRETITNQLIERREND